MGWLEQDEQKDTVKRLSLAVYQAESFGRDRSVHVTNKKYQFAVQERIIDYTIVLLWNQKHLQTSMFLDAYHAILTSLLLHSLSDRICYPHQTTADLVATYVDCRKPSLHISSVHRDW